MAKANITAHQYFTINPYIWCLLLFQNKGVHWRRIPKALVITALSIISAPFQFLEWLIFLLRRRKAIEVEDPIFIVGHWRSGTTFLHYLLGKDPKYAYLTYYQGFLPNVSIAGGYLLKKIISLLLPSKRPQDNIEVELDLPHEEENAIATFSSHSASHSFFFPENESYFKKFALLEGLNPTLYRKWKQAYRRMMQKISMSNGFKPLVIKNPHNTGRIKGLLDIYPNAKFIHIYRDPFDVIPSTFLMYDLVIRTQFLHNFSSEQIMNKIFFYYKSTMKNYFDQKSLIPENQLFEIKFEEFQHNPVHIVQNLYKKLDLEYSPEMDNKIKAYTESKKGYKKNKHLLDPQLKKRIEKECAFAFEKLGYPRTNDSTSISNE